MSDNEYQEIISFSKLKSMIISRRTTIKYLSEDIGLAQANLSAIITGWRYPKTDIIAKMAYVLKVPCSEIIEFKGIEPNPVQSEWFEKHEMKYRPPEDAKGNLSYAPLWELLEGFLETVNQSKKEGEADKTANDIFDKIEPYRRRNGMGNGLSEENLKKALRARGIEEGHISPRERHYKAKGLTPSTRTKLRNDRPLNIRQIYDICKYLGCGIDWVMSYK